jgi:hypothetical protein
MSFLIVVSVVLIWATVLTVLYVRSFGFVSETR